MMYFSLALCVLLPCACQSAPKTPSFQEDEETFLRTQGNQTKLEQSAVRQFTKVIRDSGDSASGILCVEAGKLDTPGLADELAQRLVAENEMPNPPEGRKVATVLLCAEDKPGVPDKCILGLDASGTLVAAYD